MFWMAQSWNEMEPETLNRSISLSTIQKKKGRHEPIKEEKRINSIV